MQSEITSPGPLLNDKGHLVQTGWARDLLLKYERSRVHASALRIKEWDYYEIRNDKFGLILVIYDVGYQGKIQATFLDFERHETSEASEVEWFSKGKLNLPPSSNAGDIRYQIKNSSWECVKHKDHRQFKFNFPDYFGGKGFQGEIKLMCPPDMDSMVNVIPFSNPKHFVYAQKANCMQAFGTFKVADKEYTFSDELKSYGCLDWTRAVFPYKTTWRWASASGEVQGNLLGLNFDYGFGLESSKNMIFFNHKGHHLDEVKYYWNPYNVEDDWIFESNDDRVQMHLHPTFVMVDDNNFAILRMKVLKAYGYFTGTLVLDNGEKIEISKEDKFFGHAEYAENRW
ncbi:MAG: hypothetical protein DRO88_00640 [Promethearchaeia archaeon]|nr:MAG: hypothetical protein DRO88_00640 [Candidatus Lokiarchaeia archaeon]